MTDRASGPRRILDDIRRDWREIGRPGRVALLGLVGSVIVAIALGFAITHAARGHLLDVRADLLATVSSDLGDLFDLPITEGSAEYERLDNEVRLRLLGGETVRVKLWTDDGTVVYSDDPHIVGLNFDLSPRARAAFAGDVSRGISDLSEPAHRHERDLGSLIEFYIPINGSEAAGPMAVFEVEQEVGGLETTMSSISRNVWISITSGIVILSLFLGLLFVARTRDLNRRRHQAENLLAALFRAQEEERRHIVGALHDDIGQPLYRLLYGLEGSRAKLDPSDSVSDELLVLQDLVRTIDTTLRAELHELHEGLAEDAGLEPALKDLAAATEADTGIRVSVSIGTHRTLSPVRRTALFRAAQEAVVNARKHAGASSIAIGLEERGDEVTLRVADDGVGWNGEAGLGLATTRDRLEALGGGLDLEANGPGTVFSAWLPASGAAS